MEARRRVGAFAADEAIFGGLALAGERPFLKRRLWMLGRGDLPCDHVAPVAGDEGARGLFPLIEPQRADQRFDHVGGDIVAVPPAVADRLRAKTDMRSEEHTYELQSLIRITYAVFCLKTKTKQSKS